jgi:putative transposase
LKTLCERYTSQGLLCLQDLPKSGRPIQISGEERAKITALACSKAPEGHVRWTLRLLADKVIELGICEYLSPVHAGEILKKMSYNHTSNANGASGL